MQGLPFINHNYEVAESTTQWIVLGSYQITGSTYSSKEYYDNHIFTFSKQQDVANISIKYTKAMDNTAPDTNVNNYADTVFLFEITGIPKEEGIQSGRKLF